MTTGAYEVALVGDEHPETAPAKCSGCGWRGTADQVVDVGGCGLAPGDPSPVGRCPECDWLCYLDRQRDRMLEEARTLYELCRTVLTIEPISEDSKALMIEVLTRIDGA